MRPSTWADRLLGLLVRFVGLLILLAALVAATASFFYNRAEESDRAARVAMQVNMRLRDHVSVLEGVRALYQSDPRSTGPGIRSYLSALRPQIRTPGMEGVGIAAAMRAHDPSRAEAQLRQNYGGDIKVWPAATHQAIGFPVVLVEPYTPRRHVALGFDMYSEPVRRAAMRRAWTTGEPAASGVVELVQERGLARKQNGFLIYIPVYARQPATPLTSVATRPGARPIEAFIYAPFRSQDMMQAALGEQIRGISGIEVLAGDGPSAPLLYRYGTLGWDAHDQKIRVADRLWTMRISYGRPFERLGRPLAIFLFGLALAVLATQLNRVQQRRVATLQRLAAKEARHAEDRELMMGEMAHRMKNAFARIGALARITVRESESLQDFETKFDGRLRALSDAKQMLATGAVGHVELGRIVDREFELAGWSAEKRAALAGPAVPLDEDAAQALALAIHEFVTNSIKYGALSGTSDLAVDWRREDGHVAFRWTESGLAAPPDIATESFGTQFIRSLIERQLKGSWRRTAVDNSLSIVIRWPDDGATDR